MLQSNCNIHTGLLCENIGSITIPWRSNFEGSPLSPSSLYHSDRHLFTFPVADLKRGGGDLKGPVRWLHGEKHLLPNDKSLVTWVRSWDPFKGGSRETWFCKVVLFRMHIMTRASKHTHYDDSDDVVEYTDKNDWKEKGVILVTWKELAGVPSVISWVFLVLGGFAVELAEPGAYSLGRC